MDLIIFLVIASISFAGSIQIGTVAAIVLHLTIKGIEVRNDKGNWIYMAVLTFFCCLIVVIYEPSKITNVIDSLLNINLGLNINYTGNYANTFVFSQSF